MKKTCTTTYKNWFGREVTKTKHEFMYSDSDTRKCKHCGREEIAVGISSAGNGHFTKVWEEYWDE